MKQWKVPHPSVYGMFYGLMVMIFVLWLFIYGPPARAAHLSEPVTCTAVALEGLSRVGVHLRTVPNVAVNRYHPFSGFYQAGLVSVWDVRNCKVLVHEFYHHWQGEHKALPAQWSLVWWQFERDAKVITERVFEENPELPPYIKEHDEI